MTEHTTTGLCLCPGCYWNDRYAADIASGISEEQALDDHYHSEGFEAIAALPSGHTADEEDVMLAARRAAAEAGRLAYASLKKVPTAASFRVKEEDIDLHRCLGRRMCSPPDHLNYFSPKVFMEYQCVGKIAPGGDDLCPKCQNLQDTESKNWRGRITEEPSEHLHMLGTTWARTKKPVWRC
jgi:hypothetical protein